MKKLRRAASRPEVSSSLLFIHSNKISTSSMQGINGDRHRLSVQTFVLVIEGRCRRISALPYRDHIHAVEVCAFPILDLVHHRRIGAMRG